MPEDLAVISSLSPIALALAKRLDGILRDLEKGRKDATLFVEVRRGKLSNLNVRLENIDISDTQ